MASTQLSGSSLITTVNDKLPPHFVQILLSHDSRGLYQERFFSSKVLDEQLKLEKKIMILADKNCFDRKYYIWMNIWRLPLLRWDLEHILVRPKPSWHHHKAGETSSAIVKSGRFIFTPIRFWRYDSFHWWNSPFILLFWQASHSPPWLPSRGLKMVPWSN